MSELRQAAEAVLDAWFRSGSKILEMQPHMERLAGALEEHYCDTHCTWTDHAAGCVRAKPDLSRCPKCGGPADNGHDREVPPNPYWCTRCMAQDDWK